MTKEEREKAIDLLDNLLGMVEDNQDNDYDKALKMGIESLRREPSTDAVSRKSMLEYQQYLHGKMSTEYFSIYMKIIVIMKVNYQQLLI